MASATQGWMACYGSGDGGRQFHSVDSCEFLSSRCFRVKCFLVEIYDLSIEKCASGLMLKAESHLRYRVFPMYCSYFHLVSQCSPPSIAFMNFKEFKICRLWLCVESVHCVVLGHTRVANPVCCRSGCIMLSLCSSLWFSFFSLLFSHFCVFFVGFNGWNQALKIFHSLSKLTPIPIAGLFPPKLRCESSRRWLLGLVINPGKVLFPYNLLSVGHMLHLRQSFSLWTYVYIVRNVFIHQYTNICTVWSPTIA